jgi:hypothetical protein
LPLFQQWFAPITSKDRKPLIREIILLMKILTRSTLRPSNLPQAVRYGKCATISLSRRSSSLLKMAIKAAEPLQLAT